MRLIIAIITLEILSTTHPASIAEVRFQENGDDVPCGLIVDTTPLIKMAAKFPNFGSIEGNREDLGPTPFHSNRESASRKFDHVCVHGQGKFMPGRQ
jgi:hypothetical protein